jgi:16S rRNA (cytidine1402-2'-O)-methyltransferase
MTAYRPDPEAKLAPGLYVVSTPIGNLKDITLRALEVLKGVDLVLAEDTRVAAKLLAAYGVSKKVERYDDHAGERARPKILAALADGARIALTSDAGTPLVSDPGYRLLVEAVEAGAAVIPVPGASAPLAALAVSGLPTDRFLFAGFLPPKSGTRKAALAELAAVRSTLIFFESGPRLAESLADMAEVLGPRPAVVAREITKLYETFVRGDLAALAADPRCAAPKGEIVVVVGPGAETAARPEDADAALREALARLSPSDAAAEVARGLGLPRKALYKRAVAIKAEQS